MSRELQKRFFYPNWKFWRLRCRTQIYIVIFFRAKLSLSMIAGNFNHADIFRYLMERSYKVHFKFAPQPMRSWTNLKLDQFMHAQKGLNLCPKSEKGVALDPITCLTFRANERTRRNFRTATFWRGRVEKPSTFHFSELESNFICIITHATRKS